MILMDIFLYSPFGVENEADESPNDFTDPSPQPTSKFFIILNT